MKTFSAVVLLGFIALLAPSADAHGRLVEPPGRSSAWRFGFNTPPNYGDNELFCGGLGRKNQNGGRCGVCGDAWDIPPPRPNEEGGRYATGTIVRKFSSGQTIDVGIDITANHHGPNTFKLCPVHEGAVDQACFDRHVLQIEGAGPVWHMNDSNLGVHRLRVKLPPGLRCDRCVLQWDWTAANQWGMCPDGTGRVGCGPQETFRGCADIAIH